MITRREVALGAGALSAAPPLVLAQTSSADRAETGRIRVTFITDRVRLPEADPELFGSELPPKGVPRLRRGTIDAQRSGGGWIAIPSTLRLEPATVEASRDASDLVGQIETGGEVLSTIDEFLRGDTRAQTGSGGNRKIFFVHGYRNSFRGSISSAAQLASDHGASDVFCFSWPTQDRLLGYWHDQELAPEAGKDLAPLFGRVLQLLAGPMAGQRVDVVAHSMGAQVMSGAMRAIRTKKSDLLERRLLGLTLLAAADEDYMSLSDVSSLASLPTISETVTVYTNNADFALTFSQNVVHLRARLGMVGPSDFDRLSKNVYWIDCSDLLTSEGDGASHSYFVTSPGVRADMKQVLAGRAQNEIAPRKRIGRTNKYVLPFDTRTAYAIERGYS